MREDAFLSAIAAGDDVARLAFADWLEEQDDPRAPWVRNRTIWRWMVPDARNPIPELIQALNGPSWSRQLAARNTLSLVGPVAVPALIELVLQGGEEDSPAWHAGEALGDMPADALTPYLPSLLERAASDDDASRGPAIVALRAVGPAALPALPALDRALETGQGRQHVSAAAALVLQKIGPPAFSTVEGLLELGASEPEIRDVVVSALTAVGSAAPAALLEALASFDADDSFWAVEALQNLPPAVLPLLTDTINLTTGDDSDWLSLRRRELAALALAPHSADALPPLLEALERYAGDDHYERDRYFAEAIRTLGPRAAPAAQRLSQLLPHLGWSAGRTIAEWLQSHEHADAFRQQAFTEFEQADQDQRLALISGLSHLDNWPPHLLPAVAACLDLESVSAAHGARTVLQNALAGPHRPAVIQLLLPLLTHPVAVVAEWAIEQLATCAEDLPAILLPCLRDDRPSIRAGALEALAGHHALASAFLPLTVDGDLTVRAAAAQRLGDTGSLTPASAARLRELLRSPDATVCENAMLAVAVRGPAECQAISLVHELALTGPSERPRRLAIDVLPDCLPAVECVPLLRRCLVEEGSTGDLAAAASFALRRFTERPDGPALVLSALPELLQRLSASDSTLHVLAGIGPPALPGLLTMLPENTGHLACEAIALMGPQAAPALPALTECLSSPREVLSDAAARALATVGLPVPEAVPFFRQILLAPCSHLTEHALLALGQFRVSAALGQFLQLAQDSEHAALALWAIARLEEGTPHLCRFLNSPVPEVRAVAAIELARREAGPPPSLDDLFAASSIAPLRPYLLDELSRRTDPALIPKAAEESRAPGHPRHSFAIEALVLLGSRDPEATVTALLAAYGCHEETTLRGLAEHGHRSHLAYRAVLRKMNAYKPSVRLAGIAALRRFLPPSLLTP